MILKLIIFGSSGWPFVCQSTRGFLFRARKIFKGANALSLLQTPPITKVCIFFNFRIISRPVQTQATCLISLIRDF